MGIAGGSEADPHFTGFLGQKYDITGEWGVPYLWSVSGRECALPCMLRPAPYACTAPFAACFARPRLLASDMDSLGVLTPLCF